MFTQPAAKPITTVDELDLRIKPKNIIINDGVSYPFSYVPKGETAGLILRMTFSAVSPNIPTPDVILRSDGVTPSITTSYLPGTIDSPASVRYSGELGYADMVRLGNPLNYVLDVIDGSGKVKRGALGQIIRK